MQATSFLKLSTLTTKAKILSASLAFALGASGYGGYKAYKRVQQNSYFKAVCSNHVISWLKLFGNNSDINALGSLGGGLLNNSSLKNMSFGPEQQKMEQELAAFIKEYVDTGKDNLKLNQVNWVKQYTPGYLQACSEFFLQNYPNCEQLSDENEKQSCAKKLDEEYQLMIQAAMMEYSMVQQKPWDISTANLEDMQRSYRRFVSGELTTASINSMIGSMDKAKPKTQINPSLEAWDNFVAGADEIIKALQTQPSILNESDSEVVQELLSSIDEMLTALPQKFESQRPQLENFKKAVLLKNVGLTLQYAEYFRKQEKMAEEKALAEE